MNFSYAGVDITADISINSALYDDVAYGRADRLEVAFNDVHREWAGCGVEIGAECSLTEGNLKTGTMFVDRKEGQNGRYVIGAISIPPSAKTGKERAFEDVRFLAVASELAALHGFSLETFGIENHHYERLRQNGESDFSFLAKLGAMEGYGIKAYDKKLIIFNRSQMEAQAPIASIDLTRYDGYRIIENDTWRYAACEVMTYEGVARFDAPDAQGDRVLKVRNVMASNMAEGLRFAKGLCGHYNRACTRGIVPIDLRTDIAGGSILELGGEGIDKGYTFLFSAEHNFSTVQSRLYLRKPLRGY